jgi:hypothetical protein
MKILLDKDNVVVAKSKEIVETKYSFYVVDEDTHYFYDFKVVESNLDVEPQKHKIIDKKVVVNEKYKSFEEREKETEKMKETIIK